MFNNNAKSFKFLLLKNIFFYKNKKNKLDIDKLVNTLIIDEDQKNFNIKWNSKKQAKSLNIEKNKFKFYTRGDLNFNKDLDYTDQIDISNNKEAKNLTKIILNDLNIETHSNKKITGDNVLILIYNFFAFIFYFFSMINIVDFLSVLLISLIYIFIKNDFLKIIFFGSIGVFLYLYLNSSNYLIPFFLILYTCISLNKKLSNIFFILTVIFLFLLSKYIINDFSILHRTTFFLLILIFIFRNFYFLRSNFYIFSFLTLMLMSDNESKYIFIILILPFLDILMMKLLNKIYPLQSGSL